MSFRLQLGLTHLATAVIAAAGAWYGHQSSGISTLILVIVAAVAIPVAAATALFARSLRKMESALSDAHCKNVATGIVEFDHSATRVITHLQHQ